MTAETVLAAKERQKRLADMAEFMEGRCTAIVAESVAEEHAADLRTLLADHARLEGENERLREQLAALDAGDMAKAYLMSAGPDYAKGGFNTVIRSPMGAALAQFMVECLDAEGAENYVEVTATHPEKGAYTFTVQRERGITPAQRATQAEAALTEARREASELREGLREWKCASCGGSKVFNHPRNAGPVPCKVCNETGLHPRAAALLQRGEQPGGGDEAACEKCGGAGLIAFGNGQYEECSCAD